MVVSILACRLVAGPHRSWAPSLYLSSLSSSEPACQRDDSEVRWPARHSRRRSKQPARLEERTQNKVARVLTVGDGV